MIKRTEVRRSISRQRFHAMATTVITSVSIFILMCGALPDVAVGQGLKSSPAVATEVSTAAKTDRVRFDTLREEGFDALYNLDYEGARRRFRELTRLFPDHPAGPQYLAASLWVQTLNESRRLQASLYNTESFYAKTEEKTDPKLVAQFRELTRQAKHLAEERIRRDPKDAEALYFLGAAEALKAAFAAAVERSFLSALRDGQNSVERHREVIKLDPTFHDAEVSIGTYDYVAGTLPLPVKILATVSGVRGSRKRGLETLERVARKGRWARDDARVLLLGLFKRERRFAEALVLARELAAKYPRNYLFKLEAADALVAQAAVDRQTNPAAVASAEREAFAVFDALLQPERSAKSRDSTAPFAPPRPLDLIHFSYGESLFTAGQAERAAKEFLAAATVAGAEPGLATIARLRAAQSLDVAGKRKEALVHYAAVLTRPNVYDSHQEAKRGLREMYHRPGLATVSSGGVSKASGGGDEAGRGSAGKQ
ncbi:MAG: hypothetical protein H0W76_12130 [Pyrinomonadaceae bacterium]|nr:hypothetical protein [Pyrinomonadaceae bacterium]